MINYLLLLLLIIFGLLYFTGLGWFIGWLILQTPINHNSEGIPRLQKIPILMIIGMITNYGLNLIVQSIRIGLIIGSILAIFGLFIIIKDLILRPVSIHSDKDSKSRLIGIIVTCLILLIPFIVDPISRYDARTIWFFHSKMIYYSGTIGLEAGWLNPFINFSHRDYPNLIPVIAAQISYIAGYWNEYLPKISVYLALVPGVFLFFSLAKKTFSFLALFVFVPFNFAPWLWNGYMDGLMSFFYCISLLLLGVYYRTTKKHSLVTALVSMIFLINIKNEGLLAFLALVLGIALSLIVRRMKFQPIILIKNNWKLIIGFILLITPFIVWSYYKKSWGLNNDLEIGSADSFLRLFNRLTDQSLMTILKMEYAELVTQFIIFALFLFATTAWKIKIPKVLLPVLLTTSIYLFGVTIIYLLTPRDLVWHLNSSVLRTMMTVNGGIIISWYFIFDSIENHLTLKSIV